MYKKEDVSLKIELVTMHRVCNYGSALQAYATQSVMERLGHSVEILDYYPERMHFSGMLKRLKNKKEIFENNPVLCFIAQCIIFPSYIKRFYIFRTFMKKHFKISSVRYNDLGSIQSSPPAADVYCTGSDQVWNSEWSEQVDRAFYLDFGSPITPRISYAASFGKAQLDDNEFNEIKLLLSKYKYISVREASGIDILNKMELPGELVLDPTLLPDKSQWSKLASDRYRDKKYILLYNLGREPELYDIAYAYAKKLRLPLYSVSYNLHEFVKPGRLLFCPKVCDWLSLIKNAQCVFSDSLHATAFSINFNTDFYVYYPGRFSTRLASLVELTGLKNRVLQKGKVPENENIDFSEANAAVQRERKLSFEFLTKALEAQQDGKDYITCPTS
ncbi:polysaccharide pyruvyl transferase [Ruminiclostridium sufflavum DSM 19573]|uniref:Polysaccharide pyruvyl transferase n=1 Tax=Ruminiclostridium sufflavum DSM 19573 TaxID=1121337 RepID=A0A318XMD7_9FIRM|nr:polysaccharide pyruvyl transferase family protein [Ruminiclostridium sufflavum]PYG87804.1 polysaccharide pyruvyl transferase [Ruminiclostridium sufflavum DSM 19573]